MFTLNVGRFVVVFNAFVPIIFTNESQQTHNDKNPFYLLVLAYLLHRHEMNLKCIPTYL